MPRMQNLSVDERIAATENARRESRYHFAEERIRRIVDAAPPLTELQRARLAALLLGARRPDDREAA